MKVITKTILGYTLATALAFLVSANIANAMGYAERVVRECEEQTESLYEYNTCKRNQFNRY